MNELIANFHFLRPWWLLALVPAALLIAWLWRRQYRAQSWQQLVAPELLPYLLDGHTSRHNPYYLLALAGAWLIACIALAGPAWEKRPVAVSKNQQALVVLLDLSPSMLSEDIKPSRLIRARLKIADILQRRRDGYTGLVVYAGDAHVVTPLSDDYNTIANLLPDLSPRIMPLPGSNTEAAVSRALQMLADAGLSQGELLLLTDGVEAAAQDNIQQQLQAHPQVRLSILGVGTTKPTPIPSDKGGFVRDRSGQLVTTQVNASELRELTQQTRGRFHLFSDTPRDIDYLLSHNAVNAAAKGSLTGDANQPQREFDRWYDRGHWLALLLLPIILYSFRRGLLLGLMAAPLLFSLMPNTSYALSWSELWHNPDQRAYQALQQQQPQQAAELFNDPQWKASADYRAGNYEQAAKGFAQDDSARGHYNRGNALAKAGQLDEAIKAYNQALKHNPEMQDAQRNRALLEQLKQQQKQQQQNQSQQDSQQQDSQQQDSQENSGQQNGQQNSQNQQGDNQQNSGQQGENQQNENQQGNNQQDQQQQNGQQQNGQQQSSSDSEGQALSEQEQAEEARQRAEEQAKRQAEQAEQAEQEAQQAEAEQQATQAKAEEAEQNAEQQALTQAQANDGLTDEERQAMEQWLRRVPDEPGLLLKNKFQDQYRKRRLQMYKGDWQAPENGAAERW